MSHWWCPDAYTRVLKCVAVASSSAGVHPSVVLGRGRRKLASQARSFACWLAWNLGMTSMFVGAVIERDHSTVLYHRDRFERELRRGTAWAVHYLERASGAEWGTAPAVTIMEMAEGVAS